MQPSTLKFYAKNLNSVFWLSGSKPINQFWYFIDESLKQIKQKFYQLFAIGKYTLTQWDIN